MQRRRREKEEGQNGEQVRHRKQKVRSSPCVRCDWKVGRERSGGIEGVRGGMAALCEANEERPGSMHQTAMCCPDGDWTGLHTNTYLLTFKRTLKQSHVTGL